MEGSGSVQIIMNPDPRDPKTYQSRSRTLQLSTGNEMAFFSLSKWAAFEYLSNFQIVADIKSFHIGGKIQQFFSCVSFTR